MMNYVLYNLWLDDVNWMVTALASKVTLVLYEGSPIFPNPLVLFEIAEKRTKFFWRVRKVYR